MNDRVRAIATRGGFTMVELMVALAVLAVLAAFATNRYTGARVAAYVTVMQSDLRSLIRAQTAYHSENDTYTKNKVKLDFTASPNVDVRIRADMDGWSGRAEHLNRPDKYFCAIYVGDIDAFEPASVEGVTECEPKSKKKKKK